MKECPNCGQQIQDPETVCSSCGGGVVDEGAAQAEGSESVEAVRPAVSRGRWGGLHLLAAGVTTFAVGAVTMLLLMRHPEAIDSTATFVEPSDLPTHDVSPAPPPARREDESPSVPRWIGNRQPQRSSDGSRTVAFNEGSATVELWSDSLDKQALFAPDGAVLTRQIAGSHTMRFRFTPYNASPVVVQFDVKGFDKLIGSVTRVCGWTP